MENQNRQSDESLAYRFKATGDKQAFSELINRYRESIYQKCNGYVKDEDAAKDLCQEVMIKLFLKMESYQSQAKFSTWLFSIVHNTSIDFLRKNKRNVQHVLVDKLKDKLVDLMEVEEEIPKALSIQILEDLMEQLTPQDRMLMIMRYKERHQIKDIQQALGISESAIKMRLKRARERINKLYLKYR